MKFKFPLSSLQVFCSNYKNLGSAIFVMTNNLNLQTDGGIAKFIHLLQLELKSCTVVNYSTRTRSRESISCGIDFMDVSRFNLLKLIIFLWENRHTVYYIQGVFGFRNVILPILIGSKPVVSPHGMLQEGAITKKKLVKIIYLRVLKFFLKFKNSHFIVTDSNERNEVLYFFGNVKTSVIPLPLSTIDMVVTSREKIRGQLHLVYYSVISEKKNLIFLLDVMKKVNGPVKLTIFGPIQDENYWSRCNKNISNSTLLKNSVCYKGSLLFMDYYKMCQEYDYFVLPTKGENFGYAVLENLGCGLPVVISDCTPWVFNEGSGLFSLPLENFSAWVSTIQELINQSDTDYKLARSRARDYYENFMSKTSKIGLYEKFFESNYF